MSGSGIRRDWREWDVRVHGDLVRVYVNAASTTEGHDLYPADPRTWANVFLDAQDALKLADAVGEAQWKARQHVEEDD